jgi:hypothetical protein
VQYNPEDSSEHHTRRRENLKSHTVVESFNSQWIASEATVLYLVRRLQQQCECIRDESVGRRTVVKVLSSRDSAKS